MVEYSEDAHCIVNTLFKYYLDNSTEWWYREIETGVKSELA